MVDKTERELFKKLNLNFEIEDEGRTLVGILDILQKLVINYLSLLDFLNRKNLLEEWINDDNNREEVANLLSKFIEELRDYEDEE